MRRLLMFFMPIMMIMAWSVISVPAGHAFQNNITSIDSVAAVRTSNALIPRIGFDINAGLGNAATPTVTPESSSEYVPDQILVGFKHNISDAQKRFLRGSSSGKLPDPLEKLNIFLIDVPAGQMDAELEKFKQDPDVVFAEPNYLGLALDTIPNDPDWGKQYNLVAIRAPQGWDLSTGSSAVTIAIVDSGVDLSHPDLAGKLVAGYDFVDNDTVPQDQYGHGTHVAGIAAASSNNNRGIAGVSWGAKIMPVRVLNAFGGGTFSAVANGIIWATDHGAQVINLSLGGDVGSPALKAAVDYALAKNMIVVAAAGNTGTTPLIYPAQYTGVIAVGATDSTNTRASFSDYGNELDLVAPGKSIYSLFPGNNYGYDTGTSMSAPHVAGLAAILLSIPGNPASAVEGQMESTALDLGSAGWDQFYGYGLIQMDAAIALALHTPPGPTRTPRPTSTPIFTAIPTSTPTPAQNATPTIRPSQLTSLKLPETGFAHQVSLLPAQPADKTYLAYGDLMLAIPSINVSLPIVGVPQSNDNWDVTWLGQRAGWLNKTAFPTWVGNSVITGHVWDANNTPGPFYKLNNLRYADLIEIHAWGQVYLYQVRENELISPTSANTAFQHETLSWITLLTCEGYDNLHKQYTYRRMVRAVLMNVVTGP